MSAETRMIEREADGGSWTLATRDPHPSLRPHVVSLPSFVSGVGEAAGVTGSNGRALCVQVDLTPLGARRILGVPMHELQDALSVRS